MRTLLFLSVWILAAFAQKVPSNLELLTGKYQSVLDSLTQNMQEPKLVPLVSDKQERAFLRSGWIHFWTGPTTGKVQDSSRYRMMIEAFDPAVFYTEKTFRLFGWSRQLDRFVTFHFKGWIENSSSGRVKTAFDIRRKFRDTVDSGSIDRLEQGPFRFCKGVYQTRSVWTNYIEPALMLISVSTIVYLFFSVRS